MQTPSQTTPMAETASAPTTPRSGFVAAILTIVVAAAAVWAAQQGLNSYLVTLLALLFINAALAVSLTLTNGLTGLFSLGHPAFMTIGAYGVVASQFFVVRAHSLHMHGRRVRNS